MFKMLFQVLLSCIFKFSVSLSGEYFTQYSCETSTWIPHHRFTQTRSTSYCATQCKNECVAFAMKTIDGSLQCALLTYSDVPFERTLCQGAVTNGHILVYKNKAFTPTTTTETSTTTTTTITSTTAPANNITYVDNYIYRVDDICFCAFLMHSSFSTNKYIYFFKFLSIFLIKESTELLKMF